MSKSRKTYRVLFVAALLMTGLARLVARADLRLVFDYRFDGSGFFSDPHRRAVLDRAATLYTTQIVTRLSAITPNSSNHWNAVVVRPDTGSPVLLPDLVVPEDTMVIFVGARSLPISGELAIAEAGGVGVQGATEWEELVRYRGRAGAPFRETGPWGGSIAFASDPNTSWQFHTNLKAQPFVSAEAFDFYSTALHELGHLLGLGAAASWFHQLKDDFQGPTASAVFGGPVPVEPGRNHWRHDVVSYQPDSEMPQPAVMNGLLPPGERRTLTTLDLAALRDIGWELRLPEPPLLSAYRSPMGTTVRWTASAVIYGFKLESATQVSGPWHLPTDPIKVNGPCFLLEQTVGGGMLFFRLRTD